MTSMKDVAEHAQVSIATVSRVLANKPHVRPEVREHVLKVVDELNYRPNRVASSLRTQSANIIGVLVSDIRNPFFTAIARAIEDIAHLEEMSIFLCNTDENSDKELRYLHTLVGENVAGIILSPTVNDMETFQFILNDSAPPLVTIDRPLSGAQVDSVVSNNFEAAYQLTEHLIERGYRAIGVVMGIEESFTGRERMRGCQQALQDYDLLSPAQHRAFINPMETEAEHIVHQWLQHDTPLDAILTGNSRLTIGALNAIRDADLTIPDDIGLTGFDETPWMAHAASGITVIDQPTYEMGRTAAELLLQRIANPSLPTREIILDGEIIVRGSTRQR